jgi:hypothetical protein
MNRILVATANTTRIVLYRSRNQNVWPKLDAECGTYAIHASVIETVSTGGEIERGGGSLGLFPAIIFWMQDADIKGTTK